MTFGGTVPVPDTLLALTLDALSATVALLDATGRIVLVNETWRRFAASNGLRDPAFCVGTNYLAACDRATGAGANFAAAAAAGIRDVMMGQPEFTLEYPCHAPQQARWFILRATRFEFRGQTWIVVAHENITERKLAEKRQHLLFQELSHRIKNLLSVVGSIASQSLSGNRTLDEARAAFLSRLRALSNTHDLLAGRQSTGLRALVESELKPYGKRVTMRGDDLALSPKAAQMLGLALHELATNAAKYGALSEPDGRIEIAWEITAGAPDRMWRLAWQEHGGPGPCPPKRHGFGRMLIETAVPYDLKGRAQLDFPPEGVRYELQASLDELTTAS